MTTPTRRSSAYFDALRAKALQGDELTELEDGEREWVWRSLLKGIRRKEAMVLSGIRDAQLIPALAKVKQWYHHRIETYKQQQANILAQPKVVRPVVVPPKRSGFFARLRRSS